jgi:acyl dehydratase
MNPHDLRIGVRFGPSSWLQVDQARVDAFAEATNDHQWIHTDPVRAATGPYGSTIAHGWFTLSLVTAFSYELLPLEAIAVVNYGVNRVRFPAVVPVGSRLRATFEILSVEDIDRGVQINAKATIEREHGAKPVCVAELVYIAYT